MWLVLCAADDRSARWAARGLRARGLTPFIIVTAEQLARGRRWVHRLGAVGVAAAVTLPDGRRLDATTIRGVFNRLAAVPFGRYQPVHPADRAYVAEERAAFVLSWLHALPAPVLNRPTPGGLAGRWRPASEWTWLATRAGLPVADYRHDERTASRPPALPNGATRVIVITGEVVGAALAPPLHAACRRLAGLADTAVLGIDFAAESGGALTFAGATPLPDLRLGGLAGLDLLAGALGGGWEGP